MTWNNPIAPDRLLALVHATGLTKDQRVLDVGCGSGELLKMLAPTGNSGWGIDIDADALEQAKQACPNFTFIEGDVASCALPAEMNLAVCLGSTHAFGSGPEALRNTGKALMECVLPGGHVLVGEGYQKQTLPKEYADFLGQPLGIERTHAENVTTLEENGLTCIAAITATEAEWDTFEWAFFRQTGKREWRDMWLKWGRQTMGFGVYLLEKR